ncbi:hypothetical protein DFJ43DRAFT_1036073 [Lentinula guzmanii]|uniref:Uncharacterized protein n=1 Tax=Lentinula guzmanii TaxID=2804957 RepID=A0AA38N4D8_9AGAR|nr:hypothetical protein DFJ43DRAFT_1036073 [Lentinula guzmanii]
MTTSFELAILNVMLSVIEQQARTIRYHDGKDNGVKASGVALKHRLRGEPGLYYDDFYASKFPALSILPTQSRQPSPEDVLGNEGDLDLDLDYNVDDAGTSLSSIMSCISAFEDNLAVMEQNITVPLPFVYSAHIRQFFFYTLHLYHSITGALIASFIYLGFLAAGEEIEQPVGYDEDMDSSDIVVSIFRGQRDPHIERSRFRFVLPFDYLRLIPNSCDMQHVLMLCCLNVVNRKGILFVV